MHYTGLYAGTTDCIGIYKGQPAILDFKNTRSPKATEMIKDYLCQLAAYSEAHNHLYGTDIKTLVIMMICRGDKNPKDYGNYQEWVIEGEEYEAAAEMWIKKLEQFYSKYYINL